MTFTIVLPDMCSGKNSITVTRTGHRYPTKRFQVWRDAVVDRLQEYAIIENRYIGFRGVFNPKCPLRCSIIYTPNDRRTRDIPGMEDAIYHCLERAGVIANDGLIKCSSFTTMKLAKEVRLEISLEEIGS